ncbi:hypothetical protein [Ferrimonas balearica]|uniref:hypothetical protein n=1 Tax=Ferrimonas balearica TaxID=44012 RepID=UPI001C99B40F|nr:hypothetical protein [Ferrimonas balearica]MBY5991888.1 hypothetical protein [Ferrimonas balearica]
MNKLTPAAIAVLLVSGCSSDSEPSHTLTLKFDAQPAMSPMADSPFADNLRVDGYQLERNGQLVSQLGEFSLEETLTLSVRAGDQLRVRHQDLGADKAQAFSEFYSLEGQIEVTEASREATMVMDNLSFTLVAIDERPELSHVLLNDDLLAPSEGAVRHGYVTGFNYTLIGVADDDAVGGANKQLTAPDHLHLYYFDEAAQAWSMLEQGLTQPSLPFGHRNLTVLERDGDHYRAVAQDGDSEIFAQLPALSIAEVDLTISVQAEGEVRGYTNLYLEEAGAKRCATLLPSGEVQLYPSASCASAQEKEVFASYDELRSVYPTLQFNARYFEPRRGFQNLFHRLPDAAAGEILDIQFRVDAKVLPGCDYHRVDNGTCVGNRVSTTDHSQRLTVGVKLVDGLKLTELREPEVAFSRGGEGAFINFYCKKWPVGVRSIAYTLDQDWESFVNQPANRGCELMPYRGLEGFGSHANLRSGSTTSADHDVIVEQFRFKLPKGK